MIIHDKVYFNHKQYKDIQTANAARMYAVGVLWGFRDADELLANGAKILVERPMDVLKVLESV